MNNQLFSYANTTVNKLNFPLAAKVVMIDLDGTLLDTAEDLALAANLMLRELDRPVLSVATIKSYIGKGIQRLVKRALTGDLAGEPDPELLEKALPIYKKHYAENVHVNTKPFPGVEEGIERLRQGGFHLACITNKSEAFTLPLLRAVGFHDCFEIILSGDSLPKRKPDPMPLIHICQHFKVQPHEAVLVGDSLNDTTAARAAGCHVFCVPYGYNEGRDVRDLDCDAIVPSLVEASQLIIKAAS